MAEIVNLTGSSYHGFGREVRYLNGVSAETVTADATITALSGNILFLSGGTANVDLPDEAISQGKWHLIKNTGTGVYTVRNDAGTTIVVLGAGESSYVACDGTDWRSVMDTSLTVSLDMDVALTATGDAFNLAVTMSHATQVAEGLDVSIAQLTNVRTSGSLSAIKGSITSLSGDTAGVDYYVFEGTVTVGEAGADHFLIKQGAGFDWTMDLSSAATTEAGFMLGANLASGLRIGTQLLPSQWIFSTTTASPGLAAILAHTGTASGLSITETINHATQVAGGFDSNVTQLSTARSAGYAYNYRAKTTSLAGDLNGVPYAGLYVLAPTDGGGAVSHSGLYVEAGNDYSVFSLDNVRLAFGTGAAGVPDATEGWDGTILSLLCAVDDSVYKIGNGTNSWDVWIYGNVATDYLEWDASVSTLFLRGTAGLTVVGSSILGPVSSPMTAAQDISGNGQTISLPTTGINKAISSGAARTGTILAAGTVAGQIIILENTNVSGGDTITFDATPATSRVAQGTHAIVAATAKMYTWNATASLWYPVG